WSFCGEDPGATHHVHVPDRIDDVGRHHDRGGYGTIWTNGFVMEMRSARLHGHEVPTASRERVLFSLPSVRFVIERPSCRFCMSVPWAGPKSDHVPQEERRPGPAGA